ncbi:hypothetical protein A33M_1898 [Rhodovulum sp. PH10]|uniref:hypothetical protein n=1 Tax=Rhodovulum sp. PH10 TaxID=1187851 RepID=UPI00027C28D2|nr:hypothetical protein [Rhodovulum sp. PH10]EJW12615.1 hypothetical protein A33M_1898 [Rhodovulum sp. PH10]
MVIMSRSTAAARACHIEGECRRRQKIEQLSAARISRDPGDAVAPLAAGEIGGATCRFNIANPVICHRASQLMI